MTQLPVFSIEIPNRFFEGKNRIYVIATDPLTLIDTGIASQRAYEILQQGLEEHGLSLRDVGRVILTHKHIDHIGNAWRIQRQTGAEILLHETELLAVTDVDPSGRRYGALVRERLGQWSVPQDALPPSSNSTKRGWEIESATATGLVDGQTIPLGDGHLEVIHTPGHTMGSICLKYGRYLFSGDHVLPDISPNIGAGDLRQRNLLRHYLEALNRIREVAAEDLQVMPGHGEPFGDLERRCDQLLQHHAARLEKVLDILANRGPQTVYEIAYALFGDMENIHLVLGCAEAAAHLEYLEQEGRVILEEDQYDLP